MSDYGNKFCIEEKSGVPLIGCREIPFPHGFSTRLGGVSSEPGYETLDLGAGRDEAAINENRKRFARALSGTEPRLFLQGRYTRQRRFIPTAPAENTNATHL